MGHPSIACLFNMANDDEALDYEVPIGTIQMKELSAIQSFLNNVEISPTHPTGLPGAVQSNPRTN